MKLLVIRFSSIGDLVLTTPLLRCLKTQLPNVEIHYLTKAVFSSLLEHNPHITKLHLLEDSLNEVIATLKQEQFDFVLDLHKNLRSGKVISSLSVPSESVQKHNTRKWLMVNMRFLSNKAVPHIVKRYIATAASLGVHDDNKGLELFNSSNNEVGFSDLPISHQIGFVAFAIGGAHATKRLSTDRIIALALQIRKPIVLIGGPTDRSRALEIQEAVGPRIFNVAGKYSIMQSASLLGLAKAVICHDSGAMHIACALNKPVFSIWGSTVPEIGFAPYSPESPDLARVYQVLNLSCRPCSKLGHDACPSGHFRCMRDQDIARIAADVNALFQENA